MTFSIRFKAERGVKGSGFYREQQ